jgi:twinkle protein
MGFVKHNQPCHSCGGSDPVSINDDGSAYCFSCNTFFKDYSTSDVQQTQEDNTIDFTVHQGASKEGFVHRNFNELTDRGISLATAKKYGVTSKESFGKILDHSYPYYINNEEVSCKIRKQDKSFVWTSSPKGVGLFGEQLFKAGGKYITLVEGECDAMAAYELLGSKWPVVSIRSGAAGAVRDVKDSLEFLESFENVIIAFDNDKHGREAAKKVARILSPAKAKVLSLPSEIKDSNDMLRQNRRQEFVQLWWSAKMYTPSGVMNITEQKEKFNNRERKASIPFPWHGLNSKLEGLRAGELVTLCGGTGLGKSSVTRELEHWLIQNTEDNVGVVALEEDWRRTVDGILSIEASAKLHIDSVREKYSQEELDTMFNNVFGNNNADRVWIHSHFGINDIDSIFSKLRFMIVGCGCKWIVVDHLHMLVSSTTDGDERRNIDSIMTRLRSLVEETGAGMILVSHLRRVEGNRGHENGIETGLSHLRGSQSIAQLSDCVISLERNQQADDAIEASTTRVRVLKSRYTGDVGIATHLLFDNDTGRLREVDDYDPSEFTAEEEL